MSKRKLPKEYTRALIQLAAQLLNHTGKITGAEILKDNPFAKDNKGNPIKGWITYNLGPAVNHKRRMEKAYLSGGDVAVAKYLKSQGVTLQETV